MAELGIMSCKEIRIHLDSTTSMTEDEKAVFIEENLSGRTALRHYIQKQHFSLADLNNYGRAGRQILNALGNHTKDIYDIMFDSADLSDGDCTYLADFLRKNTKRKSKLEYERMAAQHAEEGYVKQGIIKAVNSTVGAVKKVASVAWEGAKMVGSTLYSGMSYLVAWAANVGFQLWNWITRNPKAAFLTLTLLKQLKGQACRRVGEEFAWMASGNDNIIRANLARLIRTVHPKGVPSPDGSIASYFEAAKDVLMFEKDTAIWKGLNWGMQAAFDNLGTHLGAIVGGTIAAVVGVGGVATAPITAAATFIIGAAVVLCKETVLAVTEESLYIKNAENAFSMLFEVLDPITCLKDLAATAHHYMDKPPEGVTFNKAEAPIDPKIVAPTTTTNTTTTTT